MSRRPSNKDKSQTFMYYWRIESTCGIEPVPEYNFDGHLGRRHRFDWAFVDARIAVEVEGNAWHIKGGGSHMQDTDLEKYNIAASLRWLVFRFSPGMLNRDPEKCIALVEQAVIDSM